LQFTVTVFMIGVTGRNDVRSYIDMTIGGGGRPIFRSVLIQRFLSFPGRAYIFVEAFFAAFTTVAAFAVAAKAAGGIEQVGAVDPDAASLQFGGNIEGKVDVFAPYAGGQSIARVVGKSYSLGGSAESHGDQHWAEDFDLGNGGRRRNVGEERGREEIAFRGAGPR